MVGLHLDGWPSGKDGSPRRGGSPTPEAAYGTLCLCTPAPVTLAECSLVESTQCDHGDVCPPSLRDRQVLPPDPETSTLWLVYRKR